MVKICFGIISYFPWEQPERKQRQDRLDRLVGQLSDLWPEIPIIIISQQWKYYSLEGKCKNKVLRYDYPALGILKARNTLREKFLENDYDYLIMFDDDAIISYSNSNVVSDYIREIEKHPNGFCFIKGQGSSKFTDYNDSQLNLCAISRSLYEKEPLPKIDPQKSEGFEDRVWSTLLHFKYADLEFDAPSGIKCTHFKNPNEVAPSTWSAKQKFNWRYMRTRTTKIEEYIAKYKELPHRLENYYTELYFKNEEKIIEFNKQYHFMQLWGDCSGLGYLGDLRLRGPVDNVYSVKSDNIRLLLNNQYYNHIVDTIPTEYPRKKSFAEDVGRTYDYDTVKIIHNIPTTKEYKDNLLNRINEFNKFYNDLKINDNYYFTINLNNEIVDPKTNTFRNENILQEIIKILQENNILNKTIFIGLKQKNRVDTSNMFIKNFKSKYSKLKYIEIEDNDVWNTTETHLQFIDKFNLLISK